MKSLGIIRKVDELGRIVIPKETRKAFKLEEGTPLEIFVEKEKIILRKYCANYCIDCGQEVEEGDNYCKNCGRKL